MPGCSARRKKDRLYLWRNLKRKKENNKKISAHIKIDTGFGRYGFLSTEKEIILEVFKKCENINITRNVYAFF